MEANDDYESSHENDENETDNREQLLTAGNDTNDEEWKKADFLSFGNDDGASGSSAAGNNDEKEFSEDDEAFVEVGGSEANPSAASAGTMNDAHNGKSSLAQETPVYTGRQATNLGMYPTALTEPAPWQDLLKELQGGGGSSTKKSKNSPRRKYCPPPSPMVVLHNEIVEFCRLMEPQPNEKLERERLIKQVVKLVEETFGGDNLDENASSVERKCRVEVFGSQATGLYLPSSDIDLVVQLPDDLSGESNVQTNSNKLSNKKRKRNEEEEGKEEGESSSSDMNAEDNSTPQMKQSSKDSHRAKKRKEQEEMEAFSKDIQDGNSSKLHKEKVSRMRASSSSASQLSIYQQFANTLRQYHLASCSNEKMKKNKSNAEGNNVVGMDDDIDFRLSYLEVVENTRVPVVKFTHAATNISVDVCFNEKGGPEAAEYMNQCQKNLPFLRPLVFVLKYFLTCRGMNETYTGGMGSFLLQLLLVSYAQQRRREESNSGKYSSLYRPEVQANLGAMLMEFFELFGMDFNYLTTGISVRYGGYFFPKGSSDKAPTFLPQQTNGKDGSTRSFLAAVEHPLETTLDVGRGTYRIGLLQRAFETAFRTILAHTSSPAVPTSTILGTILPPTEEMWERRRDLISRTRSSNTRSPKKKAR